MALQFIDQVDFKDKKVIARFDFNVPLRKDGSLEITDTTRIDRSLPSIKHILESGASKLVLMSHLGRPKGKVDPRFTLEPVANYLASVLDTDVTLTESATDSGIKSLLSLKSNKIILLQNLRFHPEEEGNDPTFAKRLASYGDIYVNDAFGTSHRKHASTYGIVAYHKNSCCGGFLLKKEIEALNKLVESPSPPFVAIIGGGKVSDKIKIIEQLLSKVDRMIIGGAMAYPFLKTKGFTVGSSLCNDEDLNLAKKILNSGRANKIYLPVDHVISNKIGGDPEVLKEIDIPEGKMGLDIGPETLSLYKDQINDARTIFWNGPMGYFEDPQFADGTFEIAKILSESSAFRLIGGGDSVSAVNKSGLAEKMSHISTGGGASLEYIEMGQLPGVQALKFGI
ncbi:MAG: phosphoglycerate kinase [Bacteriovoracaceae bacterium]|nr:phosphoglycerate kinase [Bacteriovoracaceae bacterium]